MQKKTNKRFNKIHEDKLMIVIKLEIIENVRFSQLIFIPFYFCSSQNHSNAKLKTNKGDR